MHLSPAKKSEIERVVKVQLPPLGHSQNQPYFPFSIASRKYLQMISVWLGIFCEPCFVPTTSFSFASSQPSIPSSCVSSLASVYMSFLATLRSTARSCENLHL